jgi:hypothetical protein
MVCIEWKKWNYVCSLDDLVHFHRIITSLTFCVFMIFEDVLYFYFWYFRSSGNQIGIEYWKCMLMFVVVVLVIGLLVSSNCEHRYGTVCRWNMWWLQNVPGITLFQRNTKHLNNLSYISFKIVLLYNCILLLMTVKMLGTFHESLLGCSIAFLMMSLASQKHHPFKCWFQWREQGQIGWRQIRLGWGMYLSCHIVFC